MPDHSPPASDADFLERLAALAGSGGWITGPDAAPYYTDIFRQLETPLGVARPGSVEALQDVVRLCAECQIAMFPRGGGASYTDGFLPNRARSIVIDTGRLNRITDINVPDCIVTVEAGVTWAALKAALDPLGLRTPFFGPFSGLAATIGGSMSQHSVSHGSGAHGISAQSALSMDVVLASGALLSTGSAARGSAPFARYYGPDLTGLFTGDCGALGIKARITLPLLRQKPAFACASYAFATFDGLAAAMREAALERLDDEHFAIDAALSQGQVARQDAASVFAAARSVLKTSPNLLAAGLQLARMAASGTRALAKAAYTLHVILDGADRREVDAKLSRLRKVMHPGEEIANTVPTLVRGMPFAPLINTLGPHGERWVPLHGILAHSSVVAFHGALQDFFAGQQEAMTRLGIWTGGMFETIGSSGFLYEVALYWPGAQTAYHHAAIPEAYRANLPIHAHDEDAAAFVDRLKQQIVDLFARFGAVHFQLGKMYPYASALQPAALALVKTLKAELDPLHLMNPGALGL